jgi:uncharacterized protein YqgC (DUF456 family)
METVMLDVVAVVLVLAGLVSTVLPVLPGTLLVFGGLWLAAYAEHFARVGLVGLSIIALMGALAFGADFLASLAGAKRVGASPLALAGAAAGGFAGFFLGIPGLLLGPFAGAVAGELIARRDLRRAGHVGLGTWLGLLFGAVMKVVLACLMIATYFAFHTLNA